MESLRQFFTRKRVVIIAGLIVFILLVVVSLIFILTQQNIKQSNKIESPFPTAFPTNTSTNNKEQSFQVIETSPTNNQTNVYAGEITISFTTNTDITSANQFALDISPKLPYYWKITNSYPTKKITAAVYGRLDTNTTYVITVVDASGKKVHSWSFTTSSTPGQSSSGLLYNEEKSFDDKYYPLIQSTPYYSVDFDLLYHGQLTLNIYVKNPNVAQVKQEVIDWIKSHSVDPATHTINYINSF